MVNLKGFGSSLYQCALGCSTPVYVAVRKSLAKAQETGTATHAETLSI